MNKKKFLCAVLVAVALVAGLAGCGYQAVASAEADGGWRGVTARQATSKDKVKFKLQEDSDCETCHDGEAASIGNELCLAGNADHIEQGVDCLDCHLKDKPLESAHRKLSAESGSGDSLKRTTVEDQSCLASDCHVAEEVLAETPEDALLIDANGTAVNPHDIHNIGQSHGNILCSDCHVTHQEGETLQHASDKCLSCHHENVYECGTCH